MRISKLFTALTAIVLAGLVIHFGEQTVLAQLGGLGGRTLATEPVSIKQGQTARLEVANTSNESLIVWLSFRDSEGKVLVQKQVTIKSGAKESLEYSFAGPNNPLGQEPVLTALVREGPWFKADSSTHPNPGNKPTLYIIDNMQTVRLIWAAGFKEVKTHSPGDMETPDNNLLPLQNHPTAVPDGPPLSLESEVFMLERGQVARLELKNTGSESVAARLQFVDEQGKVLVERNATIMPGGNELLEILPNSSAGPNREGESSKLPGGPMFAPVSAQFGAAPASLLLLRPTLRIIEKQNGNTIRLIGPESFKELRPGNDPRPAPDTNH